MPSGMSWAVVNGVPVAVPEGFATGDAPDIATGTVLEDAAAASAPPAIAAVAHQYDDL